MLSTRYCRDTLVQFLRRIAIMSEDRNMCNCEYRVDSEFFDWVTGGDDYLYESELWNHCASRLRPMVERGPERMTT